MPDRDDDPYIDWGFPAFKPYHSTPPLPMDITIDDLLAAWQRQDELEAMIRKQMGLTDA